MTSLADLSSSDKQTLRTQAAAQRAAVPDAERAQAAQTLGLTLPWKVQAVCVSGYQAIGDEIDPSTLLDSLRIAGAQLCLPVLLDRQTMVFRVWSDRVPLVPAGFGTSGPDAGQPVVTPDLMLVPLVGFSAAGQRLGYGKGHYDRAIAAFRKHGADPARIGVAYDRQKVPAFEGEPHDVPLDGVITPTGLTVFDGGRTRLEPFMDVSRI